MQAIIQTMRIPTLRAVDTRRHAHAIARRTLYMRLHVVKAMAHAR